MLQCHIPRYTLEAIADTELRAGTHPDRLHDARPRTMMFAGGDEIGDYRVLGQLGEGGMGRVYLAEHVALGRHVALKQLRSEHRGDPEAVRRFLAEARIVNRIDHENIISITDFVDDDEVGCYYIMEYIDGYSLDQLQARQGVLPPKRVVGIAIQIASAITAVHRASIVHRDLKPENILVSARADGSDRVTLLDFGVAKVNDDPSRIAVRSTARGVVLGTPEYMSPEQARGEDVDGRSDVYAVGVILFEMLTGGRPFYADSFAEVASKHLTDPVPRPNAWPRAPHVLSPELDDLVVACLQKRPDDRIGSMRQVERALRTSPEGPHPRAVRSRPGGVPAIAILASGR